MNEYKPRSVFPPQFQILSGSALKTLAMVTMLIDHIGAYLLMSRANTLKPLFTNGPTIYRLSRDVGRIAFPIFVFLLVEGAMHTRSRIRYARNLLLFALISEIPWNLVHTGTLQYAKQNVYFTLLLGYIGICCIEQFKDQPWFQVLGVLALLWISTRLNADYGWKGFIFILIMYWFRYEKVAQAIGGSCWLSYEWKACFAFIPINMYNGERGFIKGNLKYVFYFFYPVHIAILYYLKYFVFV
ncbi:MAG: TraX protein [Clostridiales bacterium]|nr:TraX protein [Candidatus Blautia equi]